MTRYPFGRETTRARGTTPIADVFESRTSRSLSVYNSPAPPPEPDQTLQLVVCLGVNEKKDTYDLTTPCESWGLRPPVFSSWLELVKFCACALFQTTCDEHLARSVPIQAKATLVRLHPCVHGRNAANPSECSSLIIFIAWRFSAENCARLPCPPELSPAKRSPKPPQTRLVCGGRCSVALGVGVGIGSSRSSSGRSHR